MTIIVEVEAILNDWPITYVSRDIGNEDLLAPPRPNQNYVTTIR